MSNSDYSPLGAPNVTYLWARLLVDELTRTGVDTFFVAPGSRSTPLTVAAARHPAADVILHVDERGTSFAALGYGRATGRPAGWITTSGTAVANGRPAVVEASVDEVPVMLLTADRPPELRDTGANQTIDQVGLFGDDVRWAADVPPPTDDVDPAYVLTTVDQAVHRARRFPQGPVHLNCGFRKPLEPVEHPDVGTVPPAVEAWADREGPFTRYPTPTPQPAPADLDALARAVADAERGLVVAGRLDTAEEAAAVRRLANTLGWPLVPDLTSRLRLGPDDGAARVPYADLVLTAEAARQNLVPDAVLQVGGRFVSKRLRQFLRASRPAVRTVVRPTPARVDPDHRATHHVESQVGPFVDGLIGRVGEGDGAAEWRTTWTAANDRAQAVVADHAADGSLTEPAVATLLTADIPDDHTLVAASSMPVRDLNRHASTQGAPVPLYANRGASGIDGTVATAAGVLHGRGGPVTLLIGDLALWHDLNSLALLRDRPATVVVLNNDGGGIFHFLPIREHDEVFEPYFTTPQDRDFEAAAATFDLEYHRAGTPSGFRSTYAEAATAPGPTLIEVPTDRGDNRRVHEQLEEDVAAAVTADLESGRSNRR